MPRPPVDSNPHPTTGAKPPNQFTALVVCIDDPQKTGRVRCRVEGHMDDLAMIPDEKLPWMKVAGMNSLPESQTTTSTHGLMPGSMVSLQLHEQSNWTVLHPISNDQQEGNASTHPATKGKDKVFSVEEVKSGKYGYNDRLDKIKKIRTTQEARMVRDQTNRDSKRNDEPIKQS